MFWKSNWKQLTILLLISWNGLEQTFSADSSLSNVTNPNPVRMID